MNGVNVERDLAEIGLEIRRVDNGVNGREARIDCPFCPDQGRRGDPACGVNLETGVWRCHRCQDHGNLFTLRQRLRGGSSTQPVGRPRVAIPPRVLDDATVTAAERALHSRDGARALAYLTETRKLSEATIRRFRLGCVGRGQAGAIAIPFLASGGRCLGVKYRLLPPGDQEHKYDREKGFTLPLYNAAALDGEFRAVAITEGEFDAVAWTQYDLGIPVVSVPDGATAGLKDDAAEALVAFDEVLLVFDQDEKGDEGAAKLAARIGAFRCRRVRLPRKDANECLVAGVTRDDMLAAIAAAVACGDSAVKHISAWKDALFEVPSAHSRGIPTGWSLLDNLLGGLRQGEVTLLTADTGAGKTTWAVDLARRHADKGHAVLIASLEIGTKAISRKLLSSVAGALWDKLDTDSRTFAVNRLCDMPIYLLDRYGDVEVARLKDEMRFAVRRYGVTLVVIDHLHFALGVRKPGEDERLLIDATAHTIQTTALELGIHVLLVMHPAKIRANEDGKTRPPEIGDLKGSSGPAQFADNVVRVVRDPTQPRTALTLLKVRSELGRPGRVIFGFDPNSLRFTDLTAHADNEPPPSKGPRDFRKDSAGDKEDE